MDRFAGVILLACAQKPRREHVDARAHADQKARKERGKRRRRADGAQCVRACKLADHGDIRHIEQDLQQVRGHQRQTEDQHLLPEVSVCHVARIVPHGDQASRTKNAPKPGSAYYSTAKENLQWDFQKIFRTFLRKKQETPRTVLHHAPGKNKTPGNQTNPLILPRLADIILWQVHGVVSKWL